MSDIDYKSMHHPGENVLNWRHLKDERLYADNEYALEVLKNGLDLNANGFDAKIKVGSKMIYHCFWYGNIDRKQAFSIKSFLCTQNLNNCKVILWLDVNSGYEKHDKNPFLRAILPFIEVRAYNPVLEVKGTPWENHVKILTDTNDLVHRADAFRFLILYKYGGTYFDLDIMFLNDFGGLPNIEFCYAWEKQKYANSAILSIKKESDISKYLLQKSLQEQSASPWGIFIYSDLLLKDLYVLPCALFDPLWQKLNPENHPIDDFSKFFTPFNSEFVNKFNINSYKEFFPGCYAYHWHNQWKTPEHENSFFGIFEKEMDGLLKIN